MVREIRNEQSEKKHEGHIILWFKTSSEHLPDLVAIHGAKRSTTPWRHLAAAAIKFKKTSIGLKRGGSDRIGNAQKDEIDRQNTPKCMKE